MNWFRKLLVVLGIGLLLVPVVWQEAAPAGAQGDDDVCPAIVMAAIAATDVGCQATGRNEVCYGYSQVSATPRADVAGFTFAATGDIAPVDLVQTLQAAALDPERETWGVALMRLQANLPDALPGQNVTFVMFGDVTLDSAVAQQPALATVEVTATGGINLRGGPSTGHAVVGALSAGQVVTADGRLADNTWLRIRHPESGDSAWVFASLVTPSGAVDTLAVTDSNLEAGYGPMQAFYFRTGLGDAPCAAAPDSGILFQTPGGEAMVFLNVNGLELMVGSVGLLGDGHLTMYSGFGKFPATHQVVLAGNTQDLAWDGGNWTLSGDPYPSDPGTLSALQMWGAASGTLRDYVTTVGGAPGRYYAVPGVAAAPPETANGQVAILVHGSGESGDSWGTLADWFNDRGYAVIAPDMPGYGVYADMPDPQWGHWPAYTGHLVDMAQLYGYDGGVLVGSGDGSGAAVVTCAAHQDWCRGAILFSPTGDDHGWGVYDAMGQWGDQGLFVGGSTDDPLGTSPDVIDTLASQAGHYTTWTTSEPLHGTDLLGSDHVWTSLDDWWGDAGPTINVAGVNDPPSGPMPTSFSSDGIDVTGWYYPPADGGHGTSAAMLYPNWGLGADSWGSMTDLLTGQGYGVYTWNMPGAGLPDAPPDAGLWPAIGDDTVGYAQDQGYSDFLFGGSSFGADLALYLCSNWAGQCHGAVVLSPGDYGEWGVPGFLQELDSQGVPVWLMASQTDPGSSGAMMNEWSSGLDHVTPVIVPGDDHGIFAMDNQDLYGTLGEWFTTAGVGPMPDASGVLNTASTDDITTLDPTLAADGPSIEAVENLFLGLTDNDPVTGAVVPELATDWTVSDDGLTWTFNLRSDVNWMQYDPATGQAETRGPVTADDFVYGIQRACDPRLGAPYGWPLTDVIAGCDEVYFTPPDQATDDLVYGDTTQVSAPDATTVVVNLQSPAGYFLSMTPMWVVRPVPREPIEEYGETWTEPGNIWTNGPYFLVENVRGVRRAFARNEHLPADLAGDGNIDQITTTLVTDPAVPLSLYQHNSVDTASVPAPLVPSVQSGPHRDELRWVPEPVTYYYGYNVYTEPFDNVHARRAFSAIVDRQAFVEQTQQGQGLPMIHFTPPGMVGAPPINEVGVGFDPAYASEQLALAGYPDCDGFPTIDIAAGPGMDTWADFWAQAAEEYLGCDPTTFNAQEYDFTTLVQATSPLTPPEDRPNAWTLSWGPDYPDAHAFVGDVLHCPAETNGGCQWSEVDDLIEAAAQETDPGARDELYAEIEEAFFGPEGQFPIAPIYLRADYTLYKPWYTGPFETDGLFGGAHWDAYSIDTEAQQAARGE